MGYPLEFATRYLSSKKRASISVGTAFAILGVTLGVAALATIMSVTGGFHEQFRSKVLGVNAHVLVLKYSTNFREYRDVMSTVAKVEGVIGVAPFSINPMMLTHGGASATGVLVKGVDPKLSLGVNGPAGDEWKGAFDGQEPVLDLPRYITQGSLDGLRRPGAKPARAKYEVPKLPTVPTLPAPTLAPPMLDVPPVKDLDAPSPEGSSESPAPLDPAPIDPDPGTLDGGSRMQADGPIGEAPEPKPRANTQAPVPVGDLSALPDEDILPDNVDPDPCKDAENVDDMPGIVIGVSLAKTLGLAHTLSDDGSYDFALGDCLTVTSPTIGFSFSGGKIKPPVAKRFRVIAVFEAGFDQYDSKLVYTDLYEAQTFYDHGDTVTGVEMKVADIDAASDIADEIAGDLASGLYHTMDWEELNHGLFTALKIQQFGMSAVLALIIVVAAFTVIATLIMVVLDKQKEISVLKAMGATDFAVLRMFLYQGGIIGLLGTTAGLVLGLVVCKGLLIYGFPLDPKVYFISELPVQIRPVEFLITGVIALAICTVATIVPSLYAANLRPADGFRNR
jgi:lipoprotein-releasing system permease protein